MCFPHRWGKWEQYDEAQGARLLTKKWGLCAVIERRQRKKCQNCGKVKDELIYTRFLGDA